jgi:hypothetical protein
MLTAQLVNDSSMPEYVTAVVLVHVLYIGSYSTAVRLVQES